MGISHSQGAPAEYKIHLSISLSYDTVSAYSTIQNTCRIQNLRRIASKNSDTCISGFVP